MIIGINIFNLSPVGIWFWPVIIWTLVWKGLALWKTGRNNQPCWFVLLLIMNTVGILPILYLTFFQGKKRKSAADKMEAKFKKMVGKKSSKRMKTMRKSLKKK